MSIISILRVVRHICLFLIDVRDWFKDKENAGMTACFVMLVIGYFGIILGINWAAQNEIIPF